MTPYPTECHHRIRFDDATHSSAPSEQSIRQDATEKVLDAVMAVVDQYIPFGDSPTAIMVKEIYEAKKKAELRKQEDQLSPNEELELEHQGGEQG